MIPRWAKLKDCKTQSVIRSSTLAGLVFKLVFAISFASIIKFHDDFTVKDYNDHNLSTGLFILLILVNNIYNHVELIYQYMKQNSFYLMISVITPWLLSLLLLIDASIFLSLINWSSIFIFGSVNLILPLIVYIQSLNESEIYENNYKQSAFLDFEVN
jgi:hypothetical protein